MMGYKGEVVTIDGVYCEGTENLFKFEIGKTSENGNTELIKVSKGKFHVRGKPEEGGEWTG